MLEHIDLRKETLMIPLDTTEELFKNAIRREYGVSLDVSLEFRLLRRFDGEWALEVTQSSEQRIKELMSDEPAV